MDESSLYHRLLKIRKELIRDLPSACLITEIEAKEHYNRHTIIDHLKNASLRVWLYPTQDNRRQEILVGYNAQRMSFLCYYMGTISMYHDNEGDFTLEKIALLHDKLIEKLSDE